MIRYYRVPSRLLAVAFTIGVLFIIPVCAQVNTGDITGRVTDEQGRVVAGATVTATSKATGTTRTATTNDSGDYTISGLPAGKYDLTIEAKNFSKAIAQDFEVNVGTRPTLNFELKPGEVTATVQVTTEGAVVETTRSELGGVVTPVEVQNLPLINRTFANLSAIMPEARPSGNFDPTKARVGNIAMNGGDGRQLDVNVDGGDDKDNVVGGLLQNFAYEGIQEFQVLQHRWTAESGRAVGGVVNVVTKSGTNDLHGSGFFNFRNQSLRTRDFFEKQSTNPKPNYDREEFGGSVSGRIIKDRLFFFGAIEHFRERQNVLVNPARLPQIAAIPGVTAASTIPTPYDDTLLSIKVDHHLSGKQSMFYRYSQQNYHSPNDQFDPGKPADLTGGNTNDNKFYSFVVNHTYTISPKKLNVFSFHFQDFTNAILGVTDKPLLEFPSVQTGANVNVPQKTTERKFQLRDDFSWLAGKHSMKFGANYIRAKLGGFFFFDANGYHVFFFDDPLTIKNNLPSINCPGSVPGNLQTCYSAAFATPGAVSEIVFSSGAGDTSQPAGHQLGLYFQDDYKVTPKLTLNLGLRWDANIDILPAQTNNRTMLILQKVNDPRAKALTSDLNHRTPSFREFQPRVGFAYDPKGDGRTVIRGGYGIFYDQVFQNLTLFSQQQSNATLYQTVFDLNNTKVGVGDLPGFRFGVDPLPPAPAGTTTTDLAAGGTGRIIPSDMKDAYVQKFSFGFETQLGRTWALSSDYVHTLGIHEPRVQNINPNIKRICDPTFGGNASAPPCVRGASSRAFDLAFVNSGLSAGRLGQIILYGSNNRSLFDSWTTTIRRRARHAVFSASYVLSSSRSWGGQPVASYSSSALRIAPENQFRPGEFGPTRNDERHRIVFSGVFDLPYGIQVAPIVQLASSRPYSANAGFDLDGDGRGTAAQDGIDRICAAADPRAVLQSIVAGTGIPAAAIAKACTQIGVNSQRGGFIVDSTGNIKERSGRFFETDVRVGKVFRIGERFRLNGYANFYNLFNVENLSFANKRGASYATSSTGFLQPVSLFGPGFGPPVGIPLTVQLGFRLDF